MVVGEDVVIAQVFDGCRPVADIRRVAADLGLREHGSYAHSVIFSRLLSRSPRALIRAVPGQPVEEDSPFSAGRMQGHPGRQRPA
jgi:hypothetical protein